VSRAGDPTRLVAAVVIGLTAAALGRPLWAALAVMAGRGYGIRLVCLAVGVAAMLFGVGRVDQLDRRTLRAGPFSGVVTVVTQPGAGRGLAAVDGARETVVLVWKAGPLEQGGVYRVSGHLQPIDAVVAGYYATQGAHLDLRAESVREIGRRRGLWGVVDAAHRRALAVLESGGGTPASRGLIAGITLGDAAAIPTEDRDSLRASGLYHVVAASGQNIALITILMIVCLGLAGVIGTPARLAAAGLVVGYVLIAGAGPSIIRAGVAGLLVAAAWLVSRPTIRWHLLLVGAAVVLAFNPLELFDPGFQLSFAAGIAIYEVAPRLPKWLGSAVAISVACTLVTTPISWWHFGRLAPLSVPANLLALPVVAPILWLGIAAITIGPVFPLGARLLLVPAHVLAGYLLWVSSMCS
jgi:competence protein ComEC